MFSSAMEVDYIDDDVTTMDIDEPMEVDPPTDNYEQSNSNMSKVPLELSQNTSEAGQVTIHAVMSYLTEFYHINGSQSSLYTLAKFLEVNSLSLNSQSIIFGEKTRRVDLRIGLDFYIFVRLDDDDYPFYSSILLSIGDQPRNASTKPLDDGQTIMLFDNVTVKTKFERKFGVQENMKTLVVYPTGVSRDTSGLQTLMKAYECVDTNSLLYGRNVYNFAELGLIPDQIVTIRSNTFKLQTLSGLVNFELPEYHQLIFPFWVDLTIGFDKLSVAQKSNILQDKLDVMLANCPTEEPMKCDDFCSICRDDVKDPQCCTGCKRIIGCQKCVSEWLKATKTNQRCPLCRASWTAHGDEVLPANVFHLSSLSYQYFCVSKTSDWYSL